MIDDEHSEWFNLCALVTKKAPDSTLENMVSAEKVRRTDNPAKRMRACLDPWKLNEALVRETY